MRAWILLGFTSAAVAAAAACASSDDEAAPDSPPPDTGAVPDAAVNEAAPDDAQSDAGLVTCSAAGWCATSLPDIDLRMKDVWPLPGHAFAIAESPTLGTKVLEWRDADSAWRYIDDNTQNEIGGKYAGTIWAPNENEVYFAVAPSYVYRGTRLPPPSTGWSWSHSKLQDNAPVGAPFHDPSSDDHGYRYNSGLGTWAPALGVWGIGSGDVYAWFSNTIHHWKPDESGTTGWVAEYIADDADSSFEHLFFVSATGTGHDDLWFSGARSQGFGECALLIHKTSEGYRRVVDGLVQDSSCFERTGYLHVGGADGWLTDIQAMDSGELLGLKGANDVARFSAENDHVSVSLSPVPKLFSVGASAMGYSSLWSSPAEVWLTGWSLVARGKGVGDAATYQVSTIALNGAPLQRDMYRVRGTSSTNLWAIGNGYAFHKTTP